MERAGGSTRSSAQKNTSTKAVRTSRQDKDDNLGTPKKDLDTQELMEDAVVVLTSLRKGEVLFEKKAPIF
eukprot:13699615-Ditylum_brightwellii.AAC.1